MFYTLKRIALERTVETGRLNFITRRGLYYPTEGERIMMEFTRDAINDFTTAGIINGFTCILKLEELVHLKMTLCSPRAPTVFTEIPSWHPFLWALIDINHPYESLVEWLYSLGYIQPHDEFDREEFLRFSGHSGAVVAEDPYKAALIRPSGCELPYKRLYHSKSPWYRAKPTVLKDVPASEFISIVRNHLQRNFPGYNWLLQQNSYNLPVPDKR